MQEPRSGTTSAGRRRHPGAPAQTRRVALAGPLLAIVLTAGLAASPATADERATAVFAGGCFWCVEQAFDPIEGVIDHTAGFAGGDVADPTYDEVVDGGTGHREAVRIEYDPEVVSYDELLDVFWRNVDPLDDGGQFCDRGHTYRTGIFVADDEQRETAEASKEALNDSGRFDEPVVTEIIDLDTFYPAQEDYHQDYFEERSLRYKFYVTSCGRYGRLEEVWGNEARPGFDS